MAPARIFPVLCVLLAACVTSAHKPVAVRDKPPAKAVAGKLPAETPVRRNPEPPPGPTDAAPESPAAKTFQRGLNEYAEGNFDAAASDLQVALTLGLSKSERITAHKHLAFMYCMADRKGACRREFRKALAVDPTLELAPAEATHPVWGTVFRQAKAAGTRRRKAI